MKGTLIDTGPLVAVLSRDDRCHQTCIDTLASLRGPIYSCWPVVTEAAWLLRYDLNATRVMLKRIAEGVVKMLAMSDSEAEPIARIMIKYGSLSPQFADATLVYLAERESIDTIFTLDRRDFSIYRSTRGRPFQIIPDIN